MKSRKKYKTFKKRIIKDFLNSKFMRIFPYVLIKKCQNNEVSKCSMDPSATTNLTYIDRAP